MIPLREKEVDVQYVPEIKEERITYILSKLTIKDKLVLVKYLMKWYREGFLNGLKMVINK
jgi:hypothetical protein